MELKELKAKYEELGREIKRLESPDTVDVELIQIPQKLTIHAADKQMTWQEATDYAASIGMRLPTKFELQAIAESTDEFSELGWCWSSSTRSFSTTYAWDVYLGDRSTYITNKTVGLSVLCVAP